MSLLVINYKLRLKVEFQVHVVIESLLPFLEHDKHIKIVISLSSPIAKDPNIPILLTPNL